MLSKKELYSIMMFQEVKVNYTHNERKKYLVKFLKEDIGETCQIIYKGSI